MAASRFSAVPATLLAAALALAATPTAAEETVAPPARAYVETSYLIAPRRVDGFRLVESHYDLANKYAGPRFRYQSDAAPEIRFDAFVYPAGRMPLAEAMESGMRAFRADIGRAIEAALYTDVAIEEAGFPFAPDPDPGEPDTGDPWLAPMLRASLARSHPEGRKLAMTMDFQGTPAYSAGYLLYRQLYYFKLRASAPRSAIEADGFHAIADHAARTLLPALEAAHIGDCANSTLTIDPDATPDQLAEALISHTADQEGYNCYQDAAAAAIADKSTDAEVVTIEYEPHEWRTQ